MKQIIWALILVFLVCSLGAADFSIEKAMKIDAFMKKVAKNHRKVPFLSKVTFTQQELNSYLNLIYLKNYAPEVKFIELRLDKENLVSGTLKVKLTGEKYEKVPSFLKDFELEFSGSVETDNRRMRYIFENIRINGTNFSPEILDEAFGAAQTDFKVQKSMFDWFSLMPGLKDVKIDYRKITLFY